MLLMVEICAVIASLAVVAIAVATFRAMHDVRRAAAQATKLSGEIQLWIGEANALTREARETVASIRGIVAPLRRVADRFETLGGRTADLSAALLGEVEPQLRAAVAVARGARSVATYFLERLSQRFVLGRTATHGGSDRE